MKKGQMNYLDIILHGYYKRPKYLSQHFVRECKKAETEYYPADMFFADCAVVIEKWETDLQQQVIAGKAPFYDKLALARTGKVVFDETQWKDTPPENRLNEVIESCKQELKAISAHDYRVNLPQWAIDKYNHEQLTYSEILQIKKALKKAVKSYSLELVNNGLQELKAESPKSETKRNDVLSDLITHQNSVEIVRCIKIRYKNIKGKRLKLLLIAFQELQLIPQERTGKHFHDCCKNAFDWNIASYNAMNIYKYNERVDNVELSEMKRYIETLMKPD